MCGIIGYTGYRQASPVLLDALKRLEYRGYDSAGVAIMTPTLKVYKKKGEIKELEKILPLIQGTVGIGHTRWASCGKPSDENAHPFCDCANSIAVVHNGIIENYMSLKKQLEEEGHKFTSQTDTEVIVHLLEKYYDGDMHDALRKTIATIRGTYAIAAVREGSDEIVAARNENPMVIGIGEKENFVASDVTALLPYTNKVLYIMDGETVKIMPDRVQVFDRAGMQVTRKKETVSWSAEDAQKGGFEHFMLEGDIRATVRHPQLHPRGAGPGAKATCCRTPISIPSRSSAAGRRSTPPWWESTSWRSSPRSPPRWSWPPSTVIRPGQRNRPWSY